MFHIFVPDIFKGKKIYRNYIDFIFLVIVLVLVYFEHVKKNKNKKINQTRSHSSNIILKCVIQIKISRFKIKQEVQKGSSSTSHLMSHCVCVYIQC